MGCKSVLFFYGCLKLRFPDVEVNTGPRVAPQCCRVLFTNINGLHGNRDELAIAATKFDVVACAETKVTGHRHVSELLLPGFKATTLLLRGARPNGLGMALFVRSGLSVSRRERFECSCCEFMVAKIPVNGWIVICLLCIEAHVRMTECLIVFVKLWGASSQLILSLSFVLWVISTVTTQSGWDHASLMPMVWLLLILPLLLTVLNWLMVPLI